jgi:hypothetical protein
MLQRNGKKMEKNSNDFVKNVVWNYYEAIFY